MTRAVLFSSLALSVLATACTERSSSPVEPTPPPTPTRIIRLGGNLNFGQVGFSTSLEGVLTVSNDGNENLTITGISFATARPNSASAPNLGQWCFESLRPLSPVRFAVAPGDTLHVPFRFAPEASPRLNMIPRPPDFRFDCSGTLRVEGDHTSGTNTIAVTAIAG